MHIVNIYIYIWSFDLAEVFDRFRDENGSFDVGVADDDARGLLSLYNAAYLLTHGEAELEEAALFARQRLESMSMRGSLEYPLAQQVSRALHLPLPRTVRRVETLHYVSEYGGDPTHEHEHDPSVLEFARLDFELLQGLHVKELKALSRYDQLAIRIMKGDGNCLVSEWCWVLSAS